MSRFVKFNEDQGRRIARAVRAFEAATPDLTRDDNPNEPARMVVNPVFAVKVYKDGGASGSISTNCTWTYTVKTLSGRTLGTGKTPKARRFTLMIYPLVADGTIGTAYFDEAGVLQLLDANELPDIETC